MVGFSFLTLILFFFLISIKNYRTIGKITINTENLIVEKSNKSTYIPIFEIQNITLNYFGLYGESHSFSGWGAVYSKDGSGNILEVEFKKEKLQFNLAFEEEYDLRAIELLSTEFEKLYNLKIEIKNWG
ncbi:MAG: hypothetical protein IPH88_05560 [Bacteroidales bacterium]|nr:hypothetical protein [Bacteroidales bacterium]